MRQAAGHAGLTEGELPAVGVAREVALEGQVVGLDEVHPLPLAAEPGILDGQQDRDRIAVVDGGHVDILPGDARHPEGRVRRGADGRPYQVRRVGVGLVGQAFSEAGQPDGAMRCLCRLLSTGQDDGGAAGDVAYMFKAAMANYNPGGAIGELHKFSFDAEAADFDLIRGNVLHVAAASVSSGSSTPQQLGAISSVQKLYATLPAIAASAGDTLDVIIESDDAVGFTTPVTRATFTQIAGGVPAGEWLTPVDGPITDDWWRISWTIAGTSPSFDFITSMGIQG